VFRVQSKSAGLKNDCRNPGYSLVDLDDQLESWSAKARVLCRGPTTPFNFTHPMTIMAAQSKVFASTNNHRRIRRGMWQRSSSKAYRDLTNYHYRPRRSVANSRSIKAPSSDDGACSPCPATSVEPRWPVIFSGVSYRPLDAQGAIASGVGSFGVSGVVKRRSSASRVRIDSDQNHAASSSKSN